MDICQWRGLNHLIVSDLQKNNQQFESMVDQVEETYSSSVVNETTLESTVALDVLIQIKDVTDTEQAECSTRSKTSKL